jgi:hypothetical protein
VTTRIGQVSLFDQLAGPYEAWDTGKELAPKITVTEAGAELIGIVRIGLASWSGWRTLIVIVSEDTIPNPHCRQMKEP